MCTLLCISALLPLPTRALVLYFIVMNARSTLWCSGQPCYPFSSHTRSRDQLWELEYLLAWVLGLLPSVCVSGSSPCHLYNAYYFWKLNFLACLGLQWNLFYLARLLASFGAFVWKSCWWPADREISRFCCRRINHSDVPIHEITSSQALWTPATLGVFKY